MMTRREHNRSRIQKDLRRRRGERAFLFDKDLSRCLGHVDRDDWEFAIAISGGDVALSAHQCALTGFPGGAKVLWGRSAEEALETYRRWQKKRRK